MSYIVYGAKLNTHLNNLNSTFNSLEIQEEKWIILYTLYIDGLKLIFISMHGELSCIIIHWCIQF